MISINFLDVIILAVLIFQGVRGYKNGLLWTLAPLVYWFLAFLFSVSYMNVIGSYITQSLSITGRLAPLLGFLLCMFLAVIIGRMIMNTINNTVSKSKVGGLNQIGGATFGVIKGMLLLSVVFLVLGELGAPKKEWRDQSFLYGNVRKFVNVTWDYASAFYPQAESLANRFRSSIEGKQETTAPPDSTQTPPVPASE